MLVGPPGSKRKQVALGLSSFLSDPENTSAAAREIQCISVGDLIGRHVTQKNQQYGQSIEQALKTYSYVGDEIVIKLVK